MRFKEWIELQEVGTSTGDIAGFRRISIPMTRRIWPPLFATMVDEHPPGEEKPKKIKMQPQVQENVMANVDAVAQKISSGMTPPTMVKSYLQQFIQALDQEGMEKDPHYLHMAATVQQDILPTISQSPMFRQEASMLQALLA